MDVIDNDTEYDINTEEEDDSRRVSGRNRGEKNRTFDQYLYTIAMFVNHFAYVWLYCNHSLNSNQLISHLFCRKGFELQSNRSDTR